MANFEHSFLFMQLTILTASLTEYSLVRGPLFDGAGLMGLRSAFLFPDIVKNDQLSSGKLMSLHKKFCFILTTVTPELRQISKNFLQGLPPKSGTAQLLNVANHKS
jgi:hypothetical protein